MKQQLPVILATLLSCFSALAQNRNTPAIRQLQPRAERGDVNAQITLGVHFRDGIGVRQDHSQALHWFRCAADAGHGPGFDNVGFMYLRGWGVQEDWDIATAYFKAGAKRNDLQSLYNLGNCYFSGQGFEQSYPLALECWQKAADKGHADSMWRLATLYTAGEGVPRDWRKARVIAQTLARKGHVKSMLLAGELHFRQGDRKKSRIWWQEAAKYGDDTAKHLLNMVDWRQLRPQRGMHAYVEVDHLYQGWNNCGATTMAMFLRSCNINATPYDVKRLCPSPATTGTDWAHLAAAGKKLGRPVSMPVFAHTDQGFSDGVRFICQQLDAKRPVIVDFTYNRMENGVRKANGHTLLVVGYNVTRNQFILKNPNRPAPGIETMTASEFKRNWYSKGYSRMAKGQVGRPMMVVHGN